MQVKLLEERLRRINEQLLSLKSIDAFNQGDAVSLQNEELLEVSSQWLAITPDGDRQPLITLASKYIAGIIYDTISKNNAEQFWEYFNRFWSVKQSRASAGWMWESRVISEELGRAGNAATPLERLSIIGDHSDPPSAKRQRTVPDQICLPFSHTFDYENEASLADALVRFTDLPQKAALFLPGSRNQATFDAFSISEDWVITLFQPTISQTHSIKVSGLEFIWDALTEAKKFVKGQAAAMIQGLYPTEKKNWRLVFCVPQRVKTDWNHCQAINYKGKQRKRPWEKYIEQFVVAFKDTPGNSNSHYA